MSCGGHRRRWRCARWPASFPRFPAPPYSPRQERLERPSPPGCSAMTRRQARSADAAWCRSETGEPSCAGSHPLPRKSARSRRTRSHCGTADSSSPWDGLPVQGPSSSAVSARTDWPRPVRWRAGKVCPSRPIASRHRRGPRCLPLFDLDGPLAAPHLGFSRTSRQHEAGTTEFSVSFRPARPLAPGLPATLRVLPLQGEDS